MTNEVELCLPNTTYRYSNTIVAHPIGLAYVLALMKNNLNLNRFPNMSRTFIFFDQTFSKHTGNSVASPMPWKGINISDAFFNIHTIKTNFLTQIGNCFTEKRNFFWFLSFYQLKKPQKHGIVLKKRSLYVADQLLGSFLKLDTGTSTGIQLLLV